MLSIGAERIMLGTGTATVQGCGKKRVEQIN